MLVEDQRTQTVQVTSLLVQVTAVVGPPRPVEDDHHKRTLDSLGGHSRTEALILSPKALNRKGRTGPHPKHGSLSCPAQSSSDESGCLVHNTLQSGPRI